MSAEDHLLIDAFLEGTLNQKEKELFLKRMATDIVFKERVNFEKQLRASLNPDDWSYATNTEHPEVTAYTSLFSDPKTKALETTLKNIADKESTVSKWKNPLWMGLAAIVVVSISLFTLLGANDDPQELYVNYFDVKELPSLAVRGDAEVASLSTLQTLFEEKEYNKTLQFINDSLSISNKNKGTVRLIKAISYVETAQYAKAIESYDALIQSDLVDAEKGYWYKALVYLKLEDIEKCKSVLEEIVKNNYFNSKKARQLLKEIS